MSTDKVIFVGEQWRATGSNMTGSDVTGSHMTGRYHVRNRKYVMRMHNRKFRNIPSGTFSPEVTSVIGTDRVRMRNGTFCITTRVVVQVHGFRRGGRMCACPTGMCTIPPSGAFPPEVTSFSRAFFLVVAQNVGWGVLYDARVYPFPLLSAPFYI
jgi:hypothetical protein